MSREKRFRLVPHGLNNRRGINVWKLVGQIWAYYQKIRGKKEGRKKNPIAVRWIAWKTASLASGSTYTHGMYDLGVERQNRFKN